MEFQLRVPVVDVVDESGETSPLFVEFYRVSTTHEKQGVGGELHATGCELPLILTVGVHVFVRERGVKKSY